MTEKVLTKWEKAWLNTDSGDIHSPKGRLVYPNLLVAKPNRKIPGSAPKYNCTLLIPAGCDVSAIQADIVAVAKSTHGSDWQKKKLRLPLVKTIEEPRFAEYAEKYPLMLKSSANDEERFKPTVRGPNAKLFAGDSSEIYGGRWGVICGRAWGYTTGSLGVGWNLNSVQLADHDEPIGTNRVITEAGFEPIEVDTPAGVVAPGEGKAGSADELWG